MSNQDEFTGGDSKERLPASPVVNTPHLGLALSPLIQRSLDTFQKDLPQLLEQFPRQWVAYHGEERVGVSSSKRQLYQDCLRRGLRPGTFLVRSIELQVPREVLDLPDV